MLAAVLGAGTSDYDSARKKIEDIEQNKPRAGSAVELSLSEINALARWEVAAATEGVRNPRVELGNGTASGSALVDFLKLRGAAAPAPNWLLRTILEGERPVTVTARIRSASGRATVDVQRVEVSGIPVSGTALDYLIRNFVLTRYPEAKIGQPFQLSHRVERLEVRPAGVRVLIGR